MPNQITSFEALRRTRGCWGAGEGGRVVCPVCGEQVLWPDYVQLIHLRRHLSEGWTPPEDYFHIVRGASHQSSVATRAPS